jgi:hypothetical protein
MRDQYAGDVSDLLKFALLRTLAADDRTIGMGWYYNPAHDGRVDGCHRIDCDEPKWKSLDLALFNALRKMPERSVSALETLPIWPLKTRFHRTPVPSTGNRHSWAIDMKFVLQEASIIFLDPDNGVGSVSERHTTVAEVALMRQPERAVVLIKFPGHENHDRQIEVYHGLLQQTGAVSMVTVRTCVSVEVRNKRGLLQRIPRVRWFTIVDADDALIERAKQFAHKLNAIEKCSAYVREDRIRMGNRSIAVLHKAMRGPVSVQSPPQSPLTDRTRTVENVCPECGHQFKGNGFDGIDAHWRAKHEAIMPYKEAWPLMKSGNYHRKALRQNRERSEAEEPKQRH